MAARKFRRSEKRPAAERAAPGAPAAKPVRQRKSGAPGPAAYVDSGFMRSRVARPLRILAEYLEPRARLDRMQVADTIVFFGSTRIPPPEKCGKTRRRRSRAENAGLARYYDDARELARRLTEWSNGRAEDQRRFVICSGGGPGIMEAANRGAADARGVSIGFNVLLPFPQANNRYVTQDLSFSFQYFFMRKFWFAYLAKAMVFFPGGYGTLDEFMEILTLVQTGKMHKKLPIVLYGRAYWDKVLDFDAMVRFGTISRRDLRLFHRADTVDEAFAYLTGALAADTNDKIGPHL